jgi:hypothetical protein
MTTSGRARKPPKEPAAGPGAPLASDAAATEDLPEGALQASGERRGWREILPAAALQGGVCRG